MAAAFVCTRSEDEVLESIGDPGKMSAFLSPFNPNNWWSRWRHFIQHGYTVNVDAWARSMSLLFGDMTFLEAYQITGVSELYFCNKQNS